MQKHIDAHSEHVALLDNFGDGYLFRHNQIIRRIRNKTLQLGFNFSNQPDSDYLSFPMGQLEVILAKKIIPYIDNVTPFKKLNQRILVSLDWNHVIDNVRPNYIFHESCHAVARAMSFEANDISTRITTTLLEESFANTCEFLSIADANDQSHLLFLELNSYFAIFEDRTILKKTIDSLGIAAVFQFMLLCYLHSHFLNERLIDVDFKKIISFTSFEKSPDIKVLKSLAQNVFALNPRFRYSTTEMYLRMNNIEISVQNAIDFDYFKLITNDKRLSDFIGRLTTFLGDSNGK